MKPAPQAFSASRYLRICVPDEWYRRSRSRSNSTASYEPSEDTVKRLADLQESDEEEDGTAKLKDPTQSLPALSTSTRFTGPSDWRNSIAQNRLSSLFDSWIHSSPSSSAADFSTEKKTGSEPRLIQHYTGVSISGENVDTGETADENGSVGAQEFEEMLVSCGANTQVKYFSNWHLRTPSASRDQNGRQCIDYHLNSGNTSQSSTVTLARPACPKRRMHSGHSITLLKLLRMAPLVGVIIASSRSSPETLGS